MTQIPRNVVFHGMTRIAMSSCLLAAFCGVGCSSSSRGINDGAVGDAVVGDQTVYDDGSSTDDGSQSSLGAPVILYTDIIAGPASGGEDDNGTYLSIFGTGFGDSDSDNMPPSTTKVFINEIEVASYKYLGPCRARPEIQQLSVQVGPVTSGTIKVVTAEGESNTDHSFTATPGDIVFVSRSGSDDTGDGSFAKPYRTANFAYGRPEFDAGDFLVVRGGTYDLSTGDENLYNGRWLSLSKSGTALTNCINVMGYPGEDSVVSWGSSADTVATGIRNPGGNGISFATIANLVFDLQNTGEIALYLGFYSSVDTYFNDGRVVNVVVKGGMRGPTACEKVDCEDGYSYVNPVLLHRVDRTKFLGNNVGDNNALSGCNSHAIYLAHSYDRAELAWNYIHDNVAGRGSLQVAGDGWGDELRSERNDTGHSTSCWGYNADVAIHDNYFKNLPAEGVICNLGSFDIHVFNNIFHNMSTKGEAAKPLALRGAEQNEGIYYIYNNIFYTDAASTGTDGYATASAGGIIGLGYMLGATWGTYPNHVYLYNNIVRPKSNTTNYWCLTRAGGAPGFNPADQMTADHNLWYGSDQEVPDWAGENHLTAELAFSDPENDDFTSSGTATIDKGMVVPNGMMTADYLGKPRDTLPDIGVFEQ